MTDERPLNPVLSKSLRNLNQNLENVSKLLSLPLSSVSRVVASFHLRPGHSSAQLSVTIGQWRPPILSRDRSGPMSAAVLMVHYLC